MLCASTSYLEISLWNPKRSFLQLCFGIFSNTLYTTGCWGGGVCGCQGACMVTGGLCGCLGHAWLWGGHAWLWGGMHGCGGGHAWLPGACMVTGGVHGCRGACVVAGGVHCCGGGACVVAGGHAWLAGGGVHAWLRGCLGYDKIRSISGRYASYWNAFLYCKNTFKYRPNPRSVGVQVGKIDGIWLKKIWRE